jgi:Fur family ferric uptake transcriptional regulator
MILAALVESDALAALHALAFDDPWSGADIATLLNSPGVFALAAREADVLGGFILCRVVADEAEILTIATDPAYRRQGIARALLEAAAQAAAAGGAETLFLEVAADNAAALGLYRGAGFTPAGRRKGYYSRGPGAIDALVLRRDLNRTGAEPYAEQDRGRSDSVERLEKVCIEKGLRMTEQRRVVARVLSIATDHPDVEELHRRAHQIDPHISIATVYRAVRLFEESGILTRHDFRDGRSRYEEASDSHHDHLIDMKSGAVVEFVDDEIEALQKAIAKRLGYRLVDHRLELYAVPSDE